MTQSDPNSLSVRLAKTAVRKRLYDFMNGYDAQSIINAVCIFEELCCSDQALFWKADELCILQWECRPDPFEFTPLGHAYFYTAPVDIRGVVSWSALNLSKTEYLRCKECQEAPAIQFTPLEQVEFSNQGELLKALLKITDGYHLMITADSARKLKVE